MKILSQKLTFKAKSISIDHKNLDHGNLEIILLLTLFFSFEGALASYYVIFFYVQSKIATTVDFADNNEIANHLYLSTIIYSYMYILIKMGRRW